MDFSIFNLVRISVSLYYNCLYLYYLYLVICTVKFLSITKIIYKFIVKIYIISNKISKFNYSIVNRFTGNFSDISPRPSASDLRSTVNIIISIFKSFNYSTLKYNHFNTGETYLFKQKSGFTLTVKLGSKSI